MAAAPGKERGPARQALTRYHRPSRMTWGLWPGDPAASGAPCWLRPLAGHLGPCLAARLGDCVGEEKGLGGAGCTHCPVFLSLRVDHLPREDAARFGGENNNGHSTPTSSPTQRLRSTTADAKETPASRAGLEPGLAFGTRLRFLRNSVSQNPGKASSGSWGQRPLGNLTMGGRQG